MAEANLDKTVRSTSRRFRFRITTLLLLTGIFAYWLAVLTNRAKDERRGATAVREAGGSVRFDCQFSDDGKLLANATPPSPEFLRKAVGDEYFTRVVEAQANTQGFTDRDLAQLEGLKELRSLRIFETDITDERICSLEELARLEVVDLRNNNCFSFPLIQIALPDVRIAMRPRLQYLTLFLVFSSQAVVAQTVVVNNNIEFVPENFLDGVILIERMHRLVMAFHTQAMLFALCLVVSCFIG